MSESLKHCYDLLSKTGRSFGITISYIDEEIRDAMCVYYLVQRAVDTVEDDMTIPDDTKVTMLTSFDKYLLDPTWRYTESNDEYAIVLADFPYITQALRELPNRYSDIISEFGSRVGKAMVAFVRKEFTSIDDVSEYCRKVTSVVCMGLVDLFVAAGLEAEIQDKSLIVESFLLIQKTNILRDFRKDWNSGRVYYPIDVWSKYVNNLEELVKPENFDKGVDCVNELASDTLQYAVPYLQFLKTLRCPSAIKFFGIHQVMAMATVDRCYNNPRVFTESVKIGREETAEVISASSLKEIFNKVKFFTRSILDRSRLANGTNYRTQDICRQILVHLEQTHLL